MSFSSGHPHLSHGRDFTRRWFLPSALIKIHLRRRNPASAQTHSGPPLPPPMLSPFPCPPLPCGRSLLSADGLRLRRRGRGRGHGRSKKIKNSFGSCCQLAGLKREKKFRFSVFNPQDPRASQAKPREEEGFFGLVPLVSHPSSIPFFGGLTPKFLSLSLHSL
jgi:hypothetical protein